MRAVAIIPARGGSKGLPGKNLRCLGGAPLLAWSIAAARSAPGIERVIVSTDSETIAAAAVEWGAEAPFLRPAELARDETPDLPVFLHALEWLAGSETGTPDCIVHLRPTSPLRPRDLIERALDLIASDPAADSVRAVVPSGENPHKMWRLDPAGGPMTPLIDSPVPEGYNAPRQSLPATFWQTGHIDLFRPRTLTGQRSMTGTRILPIRVDRAFVCDIDTAEDLARAEWMLGRGIPNLVQPDQAQGRRPRLLVLDFDGVLTDNTVSVTEDGTESVRCTRSDGIGLAIAREAGIAVWVLSTEPNPVVATRCRKLGLPFRQGLADKAAALSALREELGITAPQTAYLGNDLNDLGCLESVGRPWIVADAEPSLAGRGFRRTTRAGGAGAVRELCEHLATLPPDQPS